jgi:hypothetical protein
MIFFQKAKNKRVVFNKHRWLLGLIFICCFFTACKSTDCACPMAVEIEERRSTIQFKKQQESKKNGLFSQKIKKQIAK